MGNDGKWGGGIWFKTISFLGTLLSEQKLVKSPFSFNGTRVTHADSGNFMVIYSGHEGAWSVYGQVYDRNGNEIGDTMTVSRNSSESINMYFASLFADRNNQFGAFVPGLDSMMVEKISGTGEFVGNTIVLKPGMANTQNLTGVMTRSGHYIMVWLDAIGGNIHGLRYTPEGVPIGESFQVSQKEENSYLANISLASDTSGNFVVVWTNDKDSITDMYSQLFNAEGVSVGSNTKISDEQSKYISLSGKISIGMDVDGNFVIAWPDKRSNDTTFIYLQQMVNLGNESGVITGRLRSIMISCPAYLCQRRFIQVYRFSVIPSTWHGAITTRMLAPE